MYLGICFGFELLCRVITTRIDVVELNRIRRMGANRSHLRRPERLDDMTRGRFFFWVALCGGGSVVRALLGLAFGFLGGGAFGQVAPGAGTVLQTVPPATVRPDTVPA